MLFMRLEDYKLFTKKIHIIILSEEKKNYIKSHLSDKKNLNYKNQIVCLFIL